MKSRRAAVLYLAGVFVAGVLAGGFAGFGYGAHRWFEPPDPQGMVTHLLGRMQTDLGLTDDQVTRIRPIIEEVARETDAVHRSTFERIHTAITNGNCRVEAVLTPAQRERFTEIQQRQESHFRKACKDGRPLGHPPGPAPGRH